MAQYMVRRNDVGEGMMGQIQVVIHADDPHTAKVEGAKELGLRPDQVRAEPFDIGGSVFGRILNEGNPI